MIYRNSNRIITTSISSSVGSPEEYKIFRAKKRKIEYGKKKSNTIKR
jgi:hypothetical protein